MNIRQKYELKLLADDGHIDMPSVADIFSIHLRTIRYDVQILNAYLLRELGCECIVVSNKAATVSSHIQKQLADLSELNGNDFYADRLTSEERMLLIVFDLCWDSHCSTIQNFADKYYVSRATINKDILAIKSYCKKNRIGFVSNRGKGISVEADEADRRRFLAKVIRDFTALQSKNTRMAFSGYTQWFADGDLEQIKAIVTDVENEFGTYLADVAYEALVVHIALSVERYRTNNQYGKFSPKPAIRKDSVQYRMAQKIVQQINQALKIDLPDTEIYYVSLHIGAKSSDVIRQGTTSDPSLEYSCIKMIAAVSRWIDCDLTGDEKLYESLLQHMNVCFYRKKSGMLLENPLKEELIHNYPQLYGAVRDVLENEIDAEVMILSDDEIAYILLHFATAIYRREQNANRLADVLVVCATGIGTAELVVEGLKKRLRVNIKGTVAAHQLENFLKTREVDMIISTVPLKTTHCHVIVSPMLRREDVVRIGKKILDMGFDIERPETINPDWSDTAKWLANLLRDYPSKEQEETLKSLLSRKMEQKITGKGERGYMLSNLLNENNISLDETCTDWKDAIIKSGAPLIRSGAITDTYVQAVIDNVEEVGPYIVITKGVALPHATNKAGVERTAMSLVRLINPVNFGNKANDPVKYLFMLATVDADSHLGALQDLVEFLGNSKFMEVLEKAEKPGDIVSYVMANEGNH